jgi:hypothetical protein
MVFAIQLRPPASGGESLQRAGKPLQRLENRTLAQIRKRQADVISVMKRAFGKRAILEAADAFFITIAHGVASAPVRFVSGHAFTRAVSVV